MFSYTVSKLVHFFETQCILVAMIMESTGHTTASCDYDIHEYISSVQTKQSSVRHEAMQQGKPISTDQASSLHYLGITVFLITVHLSM